MHYWTYFMLEMEYIPHFEVVYKLQMIFGYNYHFIIDILIS